MLIPWKSIGQLIQLARQTVELKESDVDRKNRLAMVRTDFENLKTKGRATQVDSSQLGRYVAAGTPVFSVVDDQHPWVDANPKETDITYLQLGQKASIYVDTFPGHAFHGTVIAVSAGTGAQFAILPPQNASGNWVKVVQRVPVRIAFEPGQDLSKLRSGMSVTVDIDTRRRRGLGSLFSNDVANAKDG